MANTLTDLMPKILARGLVRLRKRLVMPALVNRDYSPSPTARGRTVDIPVPPTVTTRAVTPGVTPVAAPDITETTTPLTLDQWHEAPIHFTDKDRVETIDQSVEMAIDAAIDALAEKVNESVMALYVNVPNFVGTAGTTPFASSYGVASEARKFLNRFKAPLPNRFVVLDPDAEEKAINLSAFADASFSSQNGVIIEGDIGRKLGYDWFMDQQVPTHTSNALGAGALTLNGNHALGVTTVSIAKGAGANWDAKKGDIISFAGHNQTYVITADVTITQGTNTNVSIFPALQVAVSTGAAITKRDTHVANLAFHRDAFALAIRPLLAPLSEARVMTMIDDATGLPLRLEVSRQNKQDYWSFDLLWGVKAIRPELGVRIGG